MTGTGAAAADELGRHLYKTQVAPAMAIAVADSTGVVWSQSYGKADMELDTRATTRTLFRIGSVSKVLTSTAAARLAVRRTIDLDAPITTWMPDLPQQHRATTLRLLLTHRGGIRHYSARDVDPFQPGGPVMSRPSWTREQILEVFVHDPLVVPVSSEVSYSSFGYSLVQLILEEATDKPFRELIAAEIAEPFSLPSLIGDDQGLIIHDRARGYVSAEEMRRVQAMFPEGNWPQMRGRWANAFALNPAFCWAGAGYLANMPDLARFGAAMLDTAASPLSADERTLLFTPITEPTQSSPPLGLGWRIDRDEKGRLRWHHAGSTPGGRAGLVVYPELSISVALAGNVMTSPGDILGPASRFADIFA